MNYEDILVDIKQVRERHMALKYRQFGLSTLLWSSRCKDPVPAEGRPFHQRQCATDGFWDFDFNSVRPQGAAITQEAPL